MFSLSTQPLRLRPATDAIAMQTAERVLGQFGKIFQDIRFDLLWQSDSLNAQAHRLGDTAHVTVYGGLARHRDIGIEGLAFAIAHEIGHHKGGAPFSRFYHWMSTDRRADQWAIDVGLPLVFGDANAGQIGRIGARQLFVAIAEELAAAQEPCAACTDEQPCLLCRSKFIGCEELDASKFAFDCRRGL